MEGHWKLSAAFVKEYIKIIPLLYFFSSQDYHIMVYCHLEFAFVVQGYLRVLGLLGLGVLGAFLPPDEMNFSRFFLERFSKYQLINRNFVSLKTKIRNAQIK